MNTIEVVHRFYELLADRDRDGLIGLLSPDIVVRYHGQVDNFPWAGRFEGIDGFDTFLAAVAAELDVVDVQRRPPISDGSNVVVPCEGHWRAKANGADVRGGMINIFTVADGRITGYEVFADTAAFRDALDR